MNLRPVVVALAVLAPMRAAAGDAPPPAPPPAMDAPPPAVALALGARISAAFPMGAVLSDPQNGPLLIDELVAFSLPLQLDAGVLLHRRWFVGAYVQYAWDLLQVGQCKVGQSCSVTGLRLGLQATYAFGDHGGPWAGLGTGWEWMFTRYSSASFTTRLDVGGWEYAVVQAGWDVEVSPRWTVGVFASGSVGEFSRASLGGGGSTVETAIDNRAVHGWLQVGVKGTFSAP